MEQAVLVGNSKVFSLLYNDKSDKRTYLAGEEERIKIHLQIGMPLGYRYRSLSSYP